MASGSGKITLYADSFIRLRFLQLIETFVDPFQSQNINGYLYIYRYISKVSNEIYINILYLLEAG